MQASDFDHRCTEPTCCIYGQPTSTSCLCHKSREDMMLAALSAERRAKEDAEAENARLARLVYVPGQWRCAKCKFTLIQANLNANDGTVTARDQPGDKCPNCDSPLWRVTERDAGNEMYDRAKEAFEAKRAAETRSAELARALDREIAHADELRQSATSATMRETWDVVYTSLRRARATLEAPNA